MFLVLTDSLLFSSIQWEEFVVGGRCRKGFLNENDCMRGQPGICNVCAAPFSLLFFLSNNQRRKITLK